MNIENFRPLFDRILIKRMTNEKTESGLFIPDVAQEKSQIGIVVAIGTGRILINGETLPISIKIGDLVYFNKYAGLEVDEDHLLAKEEEMLGIIVGNNG